MYETLARGCARLVTTRKYVFDADLSPREELCDVLDDIWALKRNRFHAVRNSGFSWERGWVRWSVNERLECSAVRGKVARVSDYPFPDEELCKTRCPKQPYGCL